MHGTPVRKNLSVTILPWGPPSTRSEKQEEYDEEDIQALVHMHVTSDKEY